MKTISYHTGCDRQHALLGAGQTSEQRTVLIGTTAPFASTATGEAAGVWSSRPMNFLTAKRSNHQRPLRPPERSSP